MVALMCGMPAEAQSPAFEVSASVASVTIHPGDTNVPLPVTLKGTSGDAPVTITLTGLPSGITVTPVTLSGSGQATLLLNASLSADQEFFVVEGNNARRSTVPQVTENVTLLAFSGQEKATGALSLVISVNNPAFVPKTLNLPVVRIDTKGVAVTSKDVDVPGTVTITSPEGQTYLAESTATFHVHGNSSAGFPKKPYNMKFDTGIDLLHMMGLECGYVNGSGDSVCDKSKSYILLANYDDKTMLRDWAAFDLADRFQSGGDYLAYTPDSPTPTGTDELKWWVPHSLFVEVYLNDAYQGTYQLTEKITIDSHRVNIHEMDDDDISGKSLTGGYLLEIDARRDETYSFVTNKNVAIDVDDPDSGVKEQDDYITDYVNNCAEALLYSPIADTSCDGTDWHQYFDEASMVNFYIVNDVMGNVDGGRMYLSDFLYKDKNNPLLYMGPVWDFDIGAGNTNYESIVNPAISWMQSAPWYSAAFHDAAFRADVVKQWNALKKNGVFEQWLAAVDQKATTLQQAQANNFGRWPSLGVYIWPNPVVFGNYDGEVSYMTNWIRARIAYLDGQFNNKGVTETTLDTPTGTLRTGSEVVLTARVTGGTSPSGTVNFMSNGAVLGVGTLDGSGIATATVTNLPAGADTLQAMYQGDSVNGVSLSSAVVVNVLESLLNATVNMVSSASSVVEGQSVQLTATVVANKGSSIPTGTFTFSVNGQQLPAVPLSAAGTASLETTSLIVGSNLVSGAYSGDATFSPANANTVPVEMSLVQTVAPVFSVAPGSYESTQTVALSDATPGAVIYYTVDGTTPTTLSTIYSAPIAVHYSQTIQAIAVGSGYGPSPVSSAAYEITPTFVLDATPVPVEGATTAEFTIVLTPRHRFSSPVTFSCVGLPADEVCSFDPAVITPQSGEVSTTLTLTRTGVAQVQRSNGLAGAGIAIGSVLFLLPFGRRRLRAGLLVVASFLIVGGAVIGGCSSSSSPSSPGGTKTIAFSVKATSGDIIQTLDLTAVVPK
ncbi:MAG TPA: CotH kinase family protein [Edaphobacter sp.]